VERMLYDLRGVSFDKKTHWVNKYHQKCPHAASTRRIATRLLATCSQFAQPTRCP
jgi:hypothetical protein